MAGVINKTACLLVLGAISACSGPSQPSPADEPTGPNTLTSAERAAGWRLLFDGRTTVGWRGFRQSSVPDGWQVADGALTRVSGGADLITIDQFVNFELTLEWMIASAGNSGIMYRVTEAADATFLTGPEMQVLDNAGAMESGTSVGAAGACYAIYPPARDVSRPAASWNDVRIVVTGNHVEHWLNGVKVVEYELGSADWLARVAASVFRDVTTYGREPRGSIALQDHGDRVAYRSIKIRSLP